MDASVLPSQVTTVPTALDPTDSYTPSPPAAQADTSVVPLRVAPTETVPLADSVQPALWSCRPSSMYPMQAAFVLGLVQGYEHDESLPMEDHA